MFKNKIALVTGGAGGIGLEYVKQLLLNDIEGVTILDINKQQGQKAEENLNQEYGSGKVKFIQADISNKDQLEVAFETSYEHWNGLDIVINNAGICNEENWEKTISLNCSGTVHGTYLGFEYMSKAKGGSGGVIVNISSIAALGTYFFMPAYSGTKSFIITFSRAVGNEFYYDSNKVKVLVVCPGLTDTLIVPDITNHMINGFGSEQKQVATEFLNKCLIQPPEFVAKHTMGLIDKAENGSVWVIENEEPPYQTQN